MGHRVHFYFCILIFIFNFITVFIKVLFFYRCLDLIVYIVPFIIVLYLSIQLQSCQSVLINLLTEVVRDFVVHYEVCYIYGLDLRLVTRPRS